MSTKKTDYPDWAEKYRGKGRTVLKTKNGYALYECTSVYVKGGPPKSKSTYLGKITEKEGFVPKKTNTGTAPVYVEYGLSHIILMNFKREIKRHIYQCSDDLMYLGVIRYIFGSSDLAFLRHSYLTYGEAERLHEIAEKIGGKKIDRVSDFIRKKIVERIPDESERRYVERLLMLCVVESGPASTRKPAFPDEAKSILEAHNMKYER